MIKYVIILVIFILSHHSYACQCIEDYKDFNIDEYYNYYDAIFIGEVVSIFNQSVKDGILRYDVKIKVDQVFRGSKKKYIILKRIYGGKKGCSGLILDEQRKYIFFSYYTTDGFLTTDRCSRSVEYYDKKVRRNIERQIQSFNKRNKRQDSLSVDLEWYKMELNVYYHDKKVNESKVTYPELSILQNFKRLDSSEYYLDGCLLAEGAVLRGKPHGKWVFYFKNGSVKSEGYFRKGKKIGVWLESKYWYRLRYRYSKTKKVLLEHCY